MRLSHPIARLRAAWARQAAAERAMAESEAQRERDGDDDTRRVGTQHWQLPDGEWIHGRPPSGR